MSSVHPGGESHHGEVDVVRVTTHVLLASGSCITQEILGRSLSLQNWPRLTTIKLVKVAVHSHKTDEMKVDTFISVRGGSLALPGRTVVTGADCVVAL